MKIYCILALLLLSLLAAPASAQTTTISGKLIDRQCSVEDAYQLQPQAEKRCTLWIEGETPCPATCGNAPTTCEGIFTVYCPNAAVDGHPFNGAYEVCSDPSAMQIRHPTKTYIIQAYLRAPAQQLDGFGQFTGFQFQY